MSNPTTCWRVQGTNRLRAYTLYVFEPNGIATGQCFFDVAFSGTGAGALGGLRGAATGSEVFSGSASGTWAAYVGQPRGPRYSLGRRPASWAAYVVRPRGPRYSLGQRLASWAAYVVRPRVPRYSLGRRPAVLGGLRGAATGSEVFVWHCCWRPGQPTRRCNGYVHRCIIVCHGYGHRRPGRPTGGSIGHAGIHWHCGWQAWRLECFSPWWRCGVYSQA